MENEKMLIKAVEPISLNDEAIRTADESALLDFKVDDYNFSKEDARVNFLKDVLSMSNTPRDGYAPGYIVVGVKHHEGEPNVIKGIPSYQDGVQYQNILSESLDKKPKVKVYNYFLDGKRLKIIEVCVEKYHYEPYVAKKDFGNKIAKGTIYFRSISSNVEAKTPEDKIKIRDWFKERATSFPVREAWVEFQRAVKDGLGLHNFLLVLPSSSSYLPDCIGPIGLLAPRAVIDMAMDGETRGAFKHMVPVIGRDTNLMRITGGEKPELSDVATLWNFVRGFNDAEEEPPAMGFKEWHACRRHVDSFLDVVCASVEPNPLNAVFIVPEPELPEHVDYIAGTLLERKATVFFVTAKGTEVRTAKYAGYPPNQVNVLDIGLEEFSDAVSHLIPSGGIAPEIALPGRGGQPCSVPVSERNWLKKSVDICYLGEKFSDEGGRDTYRKGGEPTWYVMSRHYDCDRDALTTNWIEDRIRKSLQKRREDRYNIFHAPGAGGSSLARRILWDLHREFPVGEIVSVESVEALVTRIGKIAGMTSNSVLLQVDVGRLGVEAIDQVFDAIKAGQIPAVLLQVTRRVRRVSSNDHSIWLGEVLEDDEVGSVTDAYLDCAIDERRKGQIAAVRADRDRWQFIEFGLAAYEDEYTGLTNYVRNRLRNATPGQKNIMAAFAAAYYYAQEGLSLGFFDPQGEPKHFGEPMCLADLFPGESIGLASMLTKDRAPGRYRVSHNLVAKEILAQVLSGGRSSARDNDKLWRNGLADFGMFLTDMLAAYQDGNHAKDILAKIFIQRFTRENTEQELTGLYNENKPKNIYSKFIMDVPTVHGRLGLFRRLCAAFPSEPHVYAHLARLCCDPKINDFMTANEAIDKALAISPNDHVLLHIKGNVIHKEIIALLGMGMSTTEWSKIKKMTMDALSYYDRSRAIDDRAEHTYVSSICLVRDVVEAGKTAYDGSLVKMLKAVADKQFYLDLLGRANMLLEDLKAVQREDAYERLQIQLKVLYDDFSFALEYCNSLLSNERVSVLKPPLRRLIARIYVQAGECHLANGRAAPDGGFDLQTAQKVYSLMEDNIKETKSLAKNMPLWLKAARCLNLPPSIETATERISAWVSETEAMGERDINALFYQASYLAVQVVEGAVGLLPMAKLVTRQCKDAAALRSDRVRPREWLGQRTRDVRSLIRIDGRWDDDADFFANHSNFRRLTGRIDKILDGGKGYIGLPCGIQAFFPPYRFQLVKTRDEHRLVSFFLSFSYDGPQAWDVRPMDAMMEE